jgi:hypothetical protein
VFARARQLTTWHYQWLILHEFLPLFVGQGRVDALLAQGREFYVPPVAFIPVEFQGAVYRFGHSMIRPSYRANLAGDQGQPFFGFVFDPAQEGAADPNDLRGGARAPRRFIPTTSLSCADQIFPRRIAAFRARATKVRGVLRTAKPL